MNGQKFKVVFCTPAIYSAGGVERVVTVKANYFADMLGYDVFIIVTEGKERTSFFPLSDKVSVVNLDLRFEELWHFPFLKKIFKYLRKQHRYKKQLAKELIRIQPDFTISTLRREINFMTQIKDGSIKIGELHVNRANYRSVDERNSTTIKRLFARFWRKSLVRHLKKLDKMVVLTDASLNDWPELNNVIKIPDPLPIKIEIFNELSHKRIISIGRYAYDKGNDLLLRVWSKVERLCSGWRLDIYGMGERKPYEELRSELGIEENGCGIHGPITDVQKEYLRSSVFVLPSRFEGFGLVLIEAMACGVPVISFDCENGPRSIISDGKDGFLIPPFDVDGCAEKLVLLMQNQSLRQEIGMNARKSAEKYEMDKIGAQWQQLFDELMAQR